MPATVLSYGNPLTKLWAPAHRVWTRRAWSDDWTRRPYLFCRRLNWTNNPALSSAELAYRYGRGRRQAEESFGEVERLKIGRHWVKIEVETIAGPDVGASRYWFGQIDADEDEQLRWHNAPDDANPGATKSIDSGRQTLTASGLELYLQRQPIRSSYWWDATDARTRSSEIGLTFNRGGLPNRTVARDNGVTYLFADRAAVAQSWTTRDAVEYLVRLHMPATAAGTIPIGLDLVDTNQALPTSDAPTLATEGRTLKQLLDQLLSRRRGLGYRLYVDPDSERIQVEPFTYAAEAIQHAGSIVLNANPEQRQLNFDDDRDAEVLHIEQTATAFDQVTALGARERQMFSANARNDGTVAGDWDTPEEQDYEDAASNEADYPEAGKVRERQARNATARAKPELAHVFRRFKLPDRWDFKAGDGAGGGNTLVTASADGVYRRDLELLPYLPALERHDYSGDKINDDQVTATGNPPYDYRRPFCVLPAIGELDGKWFMLDGAGSTELEDESDGANFRLTGQLRIPPAAAAVEIDLQGEPAHALAAGDFTGLAEDEDVAALSWRDAIFTIAIEDARLSATYPTAAAVTAAAAAGGNANEPNRVLVIDAGDAYARDWIHPGTVLGVDSAGDLVRSDSGGWIRDDVAELERIARVGYQWYGQTRRTVTLRTRPHSGLDVGDLVTKLGTVATATHDVGTVVTLIEIEIPEAIGSSRPAPVRMKIATGFADFDPMGA